MFKVGDLIWLPKCEDHEIGFWKDDWGIIIKAKPGWEAFYHVHWLYDTSTVEEEEWIHEHCELAARA